MENLIVPQSFPGSLLLSSVLMKYRYCLCWRLEWNWAGTGCSEEMEIRQRICMGLCAGPSYRGPCHRHHMKLFMLISPGRSPALTMTAIQWGPHTNTHKYTSCSLSWLLSFPWHDKKFNYRNLHFTAMSLDKQIVFINAVFERECLTLISPRHSTATCAFTQNWECGIMFARVFHEECFIWWNSICNTWID